MARERDMPRPKKVTGAIRFKQPDGVFLAALDIKDHVPLRVRIAEVVEYPKGTLRGGHPSSGAFTALILEGVRSGTRGNKPYAPNNTALWALFNRFGGESAWWVGQEITLDLTPRRNPNGGGIVAGIYVVPEQDERTEEQVAKKMARALRGECPYAAPEREPGADEGEAQPPDDFDQRQPGEDVPEPDDQGPPDDADLSVPA